jgi:hypothetical protein
MGFVSGEAHNGVVVARVVRIKLDFIPRRMLTLPISPIFRCIRVRTERTRHRPKRHFRPVNAS